MEYGKAGGGGGYSLAFDAWRGVGFDAKALTLKR